METKCFDRLVIFELANNHMGDLAHGMRIIDALAEVSKKFPLFRYAVKFQYRDLDTLIHPDYRDRGEEYRYIKRFESTRLAPEQFLALKEKAASYGFVTMCTPFDEPSVDRVVAHGFDILKVASCSFNDWPLLEKIVTTDKPIVISTAGASLAAVDQVVAFLEHRDRNFCLMHCVGSYPTPREELEMNQIDFFRQRYPGVPVGFSTHESPFDIEPVMIAVAKGAAVLERHVGVAWGDYKLNAYSSSPQQLEAWLGAASRAVAMCGTANRRRSISAKEEQDIHGLQRGVWLRRDVEAGETLSPADFFYAMPNQPGQLVANDISKYLVIKTKQPIKANAPLLREALELADNRAKVQEAVNRLTELIKKSGIRLRDKMELELSHHFGLDHFYETGCSIITCVNREYCKKILLLLPGQKNPTHTHHKKEETFHVLYGDLEITLNGESRHYQAGDIIVVERNMPHSFSSPTGAAFEEISTRHYVNDSFYDDPNIGAAAGRKTQLRFYADWMN